MDKVLENLPEARKNILLKNYTSFKIGGPAKYFFVAGTKEDLLRALRVAKNLKLSVFILGGGSNLLVSDNGFNGLVIKIQNFNFKTKGFEVFAEAGVILSKVVNESVKKGL